MHFWLQTSGRWQGSSGDFYLGAAAVVVAIGAAIGWALERITGHHG